MSYSSAVAQLYELGHELARTPSHKFDLAHMRVLLETLGSPQRHFRSVLIAGTNGKGSTAATLASIVRAAGHRTGLYTSPHLVRINERIRINGQPISDADFTRAHHQVEVAQSDVEIDHCDFLTGLCKGGAERGSRRRLPNAAFTRGDDNDLGHVYNVPHLESRFDFASCPERARTRSTH